MRNFIFDVWMWTPECHSVPMKSIKIECDHFPTDREVMEHLYKDEDVMIKACKHAKISYTNLREYTK
jgi:hypothetical protein